MRKHLTLTNSALLGLAAMAAVSVFVLLDRLDAEPPLTDWPRFVNGKRAFPNIQLTNQHGESVRFYEDLVQGHSVFVYFIYSRCEGT